MKSLNIGYIPAVDHLRGLAALLIFFYHGLTLIGYQLKYSEPFSFNHWITVNNPFAALLVEGHTAVALFMVLSGFIFTMGSYGSQLRYFDFVRNRFLRTYPLFVVLLATGLCVSTENFNVGALLQTLFFMGNLPGAANAGVFSAMFWAVAVEWQFYLLFPFIIFFVNRYGVKYLLGLAAVFIIMRWLAGLMGANFRDLGYWTLIGRMDQFLAGIGAGMIYRNYFRAGIRFDVLFVASSVLMLALLYAFNGMGGWPSESHFRLIWPTLEGLGWAAFILGYLSIARWLPQRVSALLIALGTISYSMYLVHFVVINIFISHKLLWLVPGLGEHANALLISTVGVLPVVLMISTLTYHVIEKPFLQLRHTYLGGEVADKDTVADDGYKQR